MMKIKLRGRYFKYKGAVAEQILTDYKSGMKVDDIVAKHKISRGGLYGLLKRHVIDEEKTQEMSI